MNIKEIQQLVKKNIPFTAMMTELVKSLLEAEGINFHVVESRTKEF